MYNKIIDPYNLKIVNINSIRGKNIIKQYLRYILGGMDPNLLKSPETSAEGGLNFSDFSPDTWHLLQNIDESDDIANNHMNEFDFNFDNQAASFDELAASSDELAASSDELATSLSHDTQSKSRGKSVQSQIQILQNEGISPNKYNLDILLKKFLDKHFLGNNYESCINLLNNNILKLEQKHYADTSNDVLTSLFGKDAEHNLISFENSVQNLLEITKNIKNYLLELYYANMFENITDKKLLKKEIEKIFKTKLKRDQNILKYVLTKIKSGFKPGRTINILRYKILN